MGPKLCGGSKGNFSGLGKKGVQSSDGGRSGKKRDTVQPHNKKSVPWFWGGEKGEGVKHRIRADKKSHMVERHWEESPTTF